MTEVIMRPKDLMLGTITTHKLQQYSELSLKEQEVTTQRLEAFISPHIEPSILLSIKTELGLPLWGEMLFALHQTKRWGRDDTLDKISGFEQFEESNLEHVAGMLRRGNLLASLLPESETHFGPQKEFVIGVLLHDLPECIVGDMPAIGANRESQLGQQVKRMESLVMRLVIAPKIQDEHVRQRWVHVYQDVTNNKGPDASSRAKVLRFLDKWDGNQQAYYHYFRYGEEAITQGLIFRDELDSHVINAFGKVDEAAQRLHNILEPHQQYAFVRFIDSHVNPVFDLYQLASPCRIGLISKGTRRGEKN